MTDTTTGSGTRASSPRSPARTIEQILRDDDGGLPVSGRRSASSRETLEVNRLVAYVWDAAERGDWIGTSMYRACFREWLIKDRLLRVDARNHEKGGGSWYGVAGPNATPKEKQALAQAAADMNTMAGPVPAVPNGSELKFERPGGTLSAIDSINRHDEAMARSWLLMVIQLGSTQTGARSVGEVQQDLWTLALEGISIWFRDVFNEHVIEDYVDWNYGLDGQEYVPRLVFWREQSQPAAAAGRNRRSGDRRRACRRAAREGRRAPRRLRPRQPPLPRGAEAGAAADPRRGRARRARRRRPRRRGRGAAARDARRPGGQADPRPSGDPAGRAAHRRQNDRPGGSGVGDAPRSSASPAAVPARGAGLDRLRRARPRVADRARHADRHVEDRPVVAGRRAPHPDRSRRRRPREARGGEGVRARRRRDRAGAAARRAAGRRRRRRRGAPAGRPRGGRARARRRAADRTRRRRR
jgi:hypothetical protein